jgi:hypothetical protein
MKAYDIIRVWRDGTYTSEEYVVLKVHNAAKPAKIVNLITWDKFHDDSERIDLHAMTLNIEEDYPWEVTGKVNTKELNHPHYKVIRKIKLMNAKRKEQGYAF